MMQTTIHPIGPVLNEPTFTAIDVKNPVFQQYDEVYATYQTADISDVRIPAFIQALTQGKPVSFQGKVYLIRRIVLCEDNTIVVLKDFYAKT